jgi:hypothetical protein
MVKFYNSKVGYSSILCTFSVCSFGWCLVLICYERNVLLADGCWLVCSERKGIGGWWLISQTNRAFLDPQFQWFFLEKETK